MFSKSKTQEGTSISNAAPPASKKGKAAAPSIFSSDLVIEGNLHSDGDIQIDGKITGKITSGSLTVGEKAVIDGDIMANAVTVRGRVLGSIRARKVQLSGTSHVEGDILHNSLAVESGAFFDGNCRHTDDPLTAEMPKSRARNESNPLKVRTVANNDERNSPKAIPSALTTPHN